ncbi:MAG: T9SS type A sorting domain-containing protein [Candidatus Fermentibacteria bacterium]
MYLKITLSIKLIIGPLLLIASTIALADEYLITDLGTLGGIWSGASDLNEQGYVVGLSSVSSGAQHGYVWDGVMMHDLGTPSVYLVSGANAINDSNQTAGFANGEFQSQYAYLWEDSIWTYLGTLPDLDYSSTTDINNANQIVGYSFMLGPGGGSLGWIWESDTLTSLGTLGGERSSANGINEIGEIVGYAQIYNPDTLINHACLWTGGGITDLGVLPGEINSAASDINESGQICGSSSHQQSTYPFLTVTIPCLWDDGSIIELELLPGYVRGAASAINDNCQIIGWMNTSLSGGSSRAFIWEDGVMTNLNQLIPAGSNWILKSASDINNLGQIVGTGEAPNGETHGYLLSPDTTGIHEYENNPPPSYLITGNFPDPFIVSTTIHYSLPEPSEVMIEIYDVLGRRVEISTEGDHSSGEYQFVWNAQGQPSGVYLYRIQAGNYSEVRKMVLLK